jgi:pimeloyl-ACP methyl ester carboxylesterase
MVMTREKYEWLDRKEYPFNSRFMQLNGQQLHYIDEGNGDTILFVHGTPSWSFDYRKPIIELRRRYRSIALDHIGFGLSDKPSEYDYSTQQHAETLEQFIGRMNLSDITLVLHDFGGPIGFHFAMKYPEKVKRIVIMNSWLWNFSEEPVFKSFHRIINSPLTPFLYKQLNFSPRFLLPKSFGKNKPSRRILKHYTKPFANASQRNGALAFARSLVNDQDWFEDLWEKKHLLQHVPILFIWGMADKFVPPSFLVQFLKGFPGSCFIKLEDCGHFPQEEKPREVTDAMQEFFKKIEPV